MFLMVMFAGGVITMLTVMNDNFEEISGPLYMKVKHAYRMESELSVEGDRIQPSFGRAELDQDE